MYACVCICSGALICVSPFHVYLIVFETTSSVHVDLINSATLAGNKPLGSTSLSPSHLRLYMPSYVPFYVGFGDLNPSHARSGSTLPTELFLLIVFPHSIGPKAFFPQLCADLPTALFYGGNCPDSRSGASEMLDCKNASFLFLEQPDN